MEKIDIIQSQKKNELMICLVVEIRNFVENYKIDIGIYDLENKRVLPRSVKQRDKCLYDQ